MKLLSPGKEHTVKQAHPNFLENSIKDGNKKLYQDMAILREQYLISNGPLVRDFELTFIFENKSEHIYLHEVTCCYFNPNTKEWIMLPTKVDGYTVTVSIKGGLLKTIPTRIGFALNQFHYSKYTQILANTFPLWTDIKRFQRSTGQHFLNYFGIKIEEVFGWIQWVSGEKYLKTVDINQTFKIYQYKIPEEAREQDFKVYKGNGDEVEESTSTRHFFRPTHKGTYLKDLEETLLFTKEDYEELYLVYDNDGVEIISEPYYVWNTLDEFGLLLDLPRKEGDSNEVYQEKLYDVFRYPSGAHKSGLQFALAKDFDLMKKEVWEDDREPYIVERGKEQLNPHAIHVDYKKLEPGQYEILDNGDVLIYPMAPLIDIDTYPDFGTKRVVGYTRDVAGYEFFNEEDRIELLRIYEWENLYDLKLEQILKLIRKMSPVMWGDAKWDRSYWDVIKEDYEGVSFLPTYIDSDLSIWSNQVLEEGEN